MIFFFGSGEMSKKKEVILVVGIGDIIFPPFILGYRLGWYFPLFQHRITFVSMGSRQVHFPHPYIPHDYRLWSHYA